MKTNNYLRYLKNTALTLPVAATLLSVPAMASSPEVKIGGAVRVNYSWKDYDNDSNGKFELELFRINAKVEEDEWFLDSEFRWYQDFNTVHHAEIGYRLDESNTVIAGITQVPFGMEPYGSEAYWFTGAYYVGLEDDHDTGIKWRNKNGNWTTDVAYFFNSEYDNGARYDRYSFDVASIEGKTNREDGQINGRVQYQEGGHTLGMSLQYGKFINSQSNDKGDHWAAGAHYLGEYGNWIVRAQLMHYDYDNQQSLGTADHRVALSAFGFPFEISTKSTLTSLNFARKFNIDNKFVKTLTCYNEYTHIAVADRPGLADSIQNVTGCSIAKGGLYTFIDWVAGKNMWFIGGPGVGVDNGSVRWRSRLNVNIGYYF